MNIVKTIQQISDDKLDRYISRRLSKLEKQAQSDEQIVLGFDIDYNPMPVTFKEKEKYAEFEVEATTSYPRYIPKNSKMVYSMYYNFIDKTIGNNGHYYLIDDDSYIKEFCKFIKKEEITNVTMLLDCIFDFIELYFGVVKIDDRERNDLIHLIYKTNNSFYNPIEEHKLSDFKKSTKAECTEIAVVAQNILKFLGFESYIIIGDISFSDEDKKVSHAFNLVSYVSKKTKKKVNLLVDFSDSVIVYDMNFNKTGLSPFIGELDKNLKESIGDLLNPDKGLGFDNYSYITFGSKVLRWVQDIERKYSMSFTMQSEKNLNQIK